MERLTQLIYEDMKPALGVTEPGAIAFAVATAKSHIQGTVQQVDLRLNSGMYKNAFTCGHPRQRSGGQSPRCGAWAQWARTQKRGWNVWMALRRRSAKRLKGWLRTEGFTFP